MTNEIGSHFEWSTNMKLEQAGDLAWLPELGDSCLTFSGRNAIETAIRDIRESMEVRSVYMPSYCCDSMTDPFLKNDIEVIYYDVKVDEEKGIHFEIDREKDIDIFFAMSYFGLGRFKQDEIIAAFQTQGKVVIEDVTHRLLREDSHSEQADYAIASLRKWFPIPAGGYVTKKDGKLSGKPTENSDAFVKGRLRAMQAKKDYLDGEDIEKQAFLDQFAEAERELKTIDVTHKIDSTSLELLKEMDIEKIRTQRQQNAAILYEGIEKFASIEPLIPYCNLTTAGPLFLPIMLPTTEARNDLRKTLIENNIYCPVHWPQKVSTNAIWTNELSLICDQRYTEEDMHHILNVIENWDTGSDPLSQGGDNEGYLF